MKEAVFILFVIAAVLLLTAVRYRRQLVAVWQVWKMVRGAAKRRTIESANPTAETARGELASCPRCGKWVAESKAIRLGSGAYYCSRDCVERAIRAH